MEKKTFRALPRISLLYVLIFTCLILSCLLLSRQLLTVIIGVNIVNIGRRNSIAWRGDRSGPKRCIQRLGNILIVFRLFPTAPLGHFVMGSLLPYVTKFGANSSDLL